MGKNKSSKGSSNGVLIAILIILLTAVVALATLFVFDVGGLKGKIMETLNLEQSTKSKSENPKAETELEKKLKDIEERQAELDALQAQLESLREELETKEKKLNEREKNILDKEKEIETLREQLSQKINDLKEYVRIYENMEGEEAAAILAEMADDDLVILILKNLNKEKSAEILGLMDPKKAANILTKMVQ